MRDDALDFTEEVASTARAPRHAQSERQPAALSDRVEELRRRANGRLDDQSRVDLGQFMTPWPTALLMASMFEPRRPGWMFCATCGVTLRSRSSLTKPAVS